MTEEIVTLKVGTRGDEKALKTLQSLDEIVKRLNEAPVNIRITAQLSAAERAVRQQAEAVQRNISANAALLQSGNALAAAELRNAQDMVRAKELSEGNTRSTEKLTQARAGLVSALEQTAQAQAKQTAASIQAAAAGEKAVRVDVRIAESAEKAAQAHARELEAKAGLVRAENALAIAREKSYQEAQKTRQAIEKTAQAEARQAAAAIQQTVSEQERAKRGFEVIGDVLIQSITRNIRKATAELKAMNAEMVTIQKVTGATDAEMQRLKDSSFDVAGALGTTPSDYLASTAKWAQAGYLALSDQLGELSAKTQVVGDVNEETANRFLLAVDAAYRYKGNVAELTRVLDGANEISNTYATSVDKLANGMGIVSSLAEQAGMKVEETMAAIGTITAKTQESGNSAARALRALILNIQGSTEIEIDTETGERWSEDEIQRTAAALGKLNVATREYRDGVMALRNPMEVIGEMSEKYRKGLITEAQIQEVVASLGGKVRSNQLMALIQGFDTYLDMIETYRDSVGSADRELEVYLRGWEAKSNRLVNQWTQFVESFKASDLSMGLLDVGNALLEIANTPWGNAAAQIGTVTAAVIALKMALKTEKGAAVLGALNVIPQGLSNISEEAKKSARGFTGLTAVMKGAKGGAVEFWKALYAALGPVGLTVAGLTAANAAYNLFCRKAAKAASALAEAEGEYERSAAGLQNLREELKGVQDRMNELSTKDTPTVVEREELDRLSRENTGLARQITIQEQLNRVKKEALDLAAQEALKAGYSGADLSLFGQAAAVFTPDQEDNILSSIQGRDFEETVSILVRNMNWLNETKEKLLEQSPDAGSWTEKEKESIEALDERLKACGAVAAGVYQELRSNSEKLADDGLKEHWDEVGDVLYAAMFPAETMTEKFHRLADAMDEADRTRLTELLERFRKDGQVTAQEVQNLLDRFPVLKQLLDENGGSLERLARYLTETAGAAEEAAGGIDAVGGSAEGSRQNMEELAKALKTAVSGMEAVRDAQDELKHNGQLSTNTLISLLGRYEDSIDNVILKALAGAATQEEVSAALEKAYRSDLDAYRSALLAKEMDNGDFYTSWLANNAGTVKALAGQYGIDVGNYRTFSELKQAIEAAEQQAETRAVREGAADRTAIFENIRDAFSATQDAMVIKAREATGLISGMYAGLAGMMGGIAKGMSAAGGIIGSTAAAAAGQIRAQQEQSAWQKVLDSIRAPVSAPKTSSKSGGGGVSGKSYYEQQIENLKKLEEAVKRTNQVLEKSDGDTAGQRLDNLRDLQNKALAMQKDFIARGKAEASDEVNQVKLLYAGLGEDIRSIYASMTDQITEQHDRLIREFDLKANNSRSMEQIAADDAAMVDQYRQMQQEVHQLAQRYRAQGVRENDKLIQNLQDRWWDYEKSIRSMYQNLTGAFRDYIDESSHKIEELGRATDTVGQQIEIYVQRIRKAQETIAALQGHNINGALNGDIHDLESQIWGDKDAIRDIQDALWDELERAFDDIFDRAKEDVEAVGKEIEAIQDQMDEINDVLSRYDRELEGILKPINATIEKLNEQLEAEKKRLEEHTSPLKDRREELEDKINGYYTVNPDGSIGAYIPGLNDEIDAIQSKIDQVDQQLEDANAELDRVQNAWSEQKKREEEALALQKKQLAVEEAQKAVQDALLALQTARSERNIYTLKDGVWAWRADEEAVAKAEQALADAEKAKEEAEKDLQDYKEEQAHRQILKRLEEQVRTLEEQKKGLEEQKKLVDRQKELLNRQIEAINKQIDACEKESQARQDLIQSLIDRNEQEKKAWEDHYAALKEQYSQQLDALEAEKKAAEKRKEEAQRQYDQWMDTWKDIQKSIETPARDISEILNDIARYGTPAMAGQVDRVTDLLRQLGYVLEDVASGGGYNPDDDWNGGGSSGDNRTERQRIIDQMLANALAYQGASKDEQKRLYEENQWLGAQIGAHWDEKTSTWDIFDYSGGTVTVKPGAYESRAGISPAAYSGGGGVPADGGGQEDWYINERGQLCIDGLVLDPAPHYTLEDLENSEWVKNKARYGCITSDDIRPGPPPLIPLSQLGQTSYDYSQHFTVNGLKLGTDMMQRPVSDIFKLFPLYMGT